MILTIETAGYCRRGIDRNVLTLGDGPSTRTDKFKFMPKLKGIRSAEKHNEKEVLAPNVCEESPNQASGQFSAVIQCFTDNAAPVIGFQPIG